MSSTRNRNTSLDYNLEKQKNKNLENHYLYIHSSSGRPTSECIPSLGYIPSHMSRDALSNNAIDIESTLYGIGSSNLVNPCYPVVPSLRPIEFKHYFNKSETLIMPNPFIFNNDERPTLT